MSTGIETAELIEPWLYSTLIADPQLVADVGDRIYGPLTPDEISGAYISMSLLSLRDIRGIGTDRFMVDAIYLIKVIAQTTSQDDVLPAFQRVCALLDGVTNVSYAGGTLDCVRETIVSFADTAHSTTGVSSVPFYHLGGNFHIYASK